MNPIRFIAAILALPAPTAVRAEPPGAQAGDSYEITRIVHSSNESSDGASGNSNDRSIILERVVAMRADGVELEYDLPKIEGGEASAANWQFPARVFKPNRGPLKLLNRPELEARVEAWLKKAKWPREVCGRWIFTWNAFRIECDPQSAIGIIQVYDLGPPIVDEGAPYSAPFARAPGRLTRKAGPQGSTFAARMEVDPDAVRRGRAEADVAVGEMTGKPVTLEAALGKRTKDSVSGTISVTLEVDPAGQIRRRTTVTRLEMREPGGRTETAITTETVERRRARSADG